MTLGDKLRAARERSEAQRTWKFRPEVLLGANIPKPMHGLAPRTVLGEAWWNATRKAAYASTDYHCVACGVHKASARYHQWLEGHELYAISYEAGRMVYVETVPLCHFCHNYIHDGRLRWLLEKGEIHHAKYVAIIQHGDKVLADSGLRRLGYKEREENIQEALTNGRVAAWEDWRLVIEGAEYPSLYKSYEDWERKQRSR